MKCRGLLFDLDGVLVDSTPAVARVWAGWARERGFDPDKVVREAHGRPSIATIRGLLPPADHATDDELQEAGSDWIVDDCAALFLDSASADQDFLLLGRRTK